jgi:transcriptional regulator with XRE-family HTH domain
MEAVAERVGISRQHLVQLTKGIIITPGLSTLCNLEKELELKEGELLGFTYSGFKSDVAVPGKDQGPRSFSLARNLMPPPPRAKRSNDVLRDHIGPWCAKCLGYLEHREIGTYHPFGIIP